MAVSFVYITIWCLLSAACYLDLAKTETVPTCVSVYHEFEEAAITNSPANVHSLFSVLYSPNHPLPFSLVIHYQVQLPNGTTVRVSSDTGCPSELWMWTYSPVFLWFEPSLLNKFTLYAMNGAVRWNSPTVTLTVPLPCQNVSYSFLNEMTMAAHSYALGEVEHKRHLGFVLYGCGKTVEQSIIYPSSIHGDHKFKRRLTKIRFALTFSSLFQAVFVFLATIMLFNKWLPKVAATPSNFPTQVYSQFWAICTAASIIWALFTSADLYSVVTIFPYHPVITSSAIVVVLFVALIEAPVAVYFAKRYTVAVPGVYLVPAKVLCCGNEKISALAVRVVLLLMTLMAIQITICHCTFLLLALGAVPFNIISTVALVIFVFFATVHVLAILFALPSLCRQPVATGTISRGEKCHAIIQAVSCVILLIALFCFSSVVGMSGRLINVGTDQEGFFLPLGKIIFPLAFGLASMLLRRFSNMWWEALASHRLWAITTESADEPLNPKANYDAI